MVEEPRAFIFRGRRDLVKKRGFRVELGEIEGVPAPAHGRGGPRSSRRSDDEGGHIVAFVAAKGGGRLSLIAPQAVLRRPHPLYMVPDAFSFLPAATIAHGRMTTSA